jgi:transaldolase/glucose-6-phosphate isomerase
MPDPASTLSGLPEMQLPNDLAATVDDALTRARDDHWAERLFDRDATLWSSDERAQAAILDRLGWLVSPEHFSRDVPALEGFANGIREAGFRSALVMGMGGSSLAPDVLARTFGVTGDGIEVAVLDSTDPAAVRAALDDRDPLATLFIVASKSGTTTEPRAFQAEAWARLADALEANESEQSPGELMVAITDPGKPASAIPHHDELRELFLNPPDIGGRYSALSYVGLVPAALLGLDLDAILANALAMLGRCRDLEPARNPGVVLGVAMGALAKAGRDKLTLLPDPEIAAFGAWAEQLIAESTGKHGLGIVPVDLEPLAPAGTYGNDRVFVRLRLAGSAGHPEADRLAAELRSLGQPVIELHLADRLDVAGEFVRWEVATAIAGAVLGIDPFDQPNVEEAKELTRRVLAGHGADGDGAPAVETAPIATDGPLALHGDAALRLTGGDGTLVGELSRHLARRRPNAYLAIQAFIAPTPGRDAALARLRGALLSGTGRATTAGYGPRFLHSTGQLHKGGPASGWFLQLTSDHPDDLPIPEWPYTFGQLIDAQAVGDFAAIETHDLPILRVHLGPDVDAGLAVLESAIAAALATPAQEA